MSLLVLAIGAVASPPSASGAIVPGLLDSAFGAAGLAKAQVSADGGGNAVAIQADGSMVVAGQTSLYGASEFEAARFLPNGAVDRTFGDDGRVTVTVGDHSSAAGALALANGKVLLTGAAAVGGTLEFAAIRLLSDGRLDPTFGGDGIVTVPVGMWAMAMAAVPAGNGRVIIGGHAKVREDATATQKIEKWAFAAVRLNENGTLDSTYGAGGRATFAAPSATYGIAIQPDGKLVFGGEALLEGRRVAAAGRLTAAGAPDAAFGDNGIAVVPTAERAGATGVAIDPNGSIILAGNLLDTPHTAIAARLRPDGSLDPQFGTSGIVKVFAGGAGNGLVRQPDGKLLIAAANGFRVMRLHADGRTDTSFGLGGVVTVPVVGTGAANGVALQPDGRIVLGGHLIAPDRSGYLAAVRIYSGLELLPEPGPDPEPDPEPTRPPSPPSSPPPAPQPPEATQPPARTEGETATTPDEAAPQTKLRSNPPRHIRAKRGRAKVRFRFAATERRARFRCALNGRVYRRCGARHTVRVGPGRHRLRVRAVDAAGNADASPLVVRWRVRR